MAFEVCGMTVECVNLGVSVHIWEDELFLPCVNMAPLLVLGTVMDTHLMLQGIMALGPNV